MLPIDPIKTVDRTPNSSGQKVPTQAAVIGSQAANTFPLILTDVIMTCSSHHVLQKKIPLNTLQRFIKSSGCTDLCQIFPDWFPQFFIDFL